jgi:transcriptional regulator with XRE-family HTH domain
METFGERLKHALSLKGSTLGALALDLDRTGHGVTRSAVGHWSRGRCTPDMATINAIADALGVRAAWLAFGEGKPRARRAA